MNIAFEKLIKKPLLGEYIKHSLLFQQQAQASAAARVRNSWYIYIKTSMLNCLQQPAAAARIKNKRLDVVLLYIVIIIIIIPFCLVAHHC